MARDSRSVSTLWSDIGLREGDDIIHDVLVNPGSTIISSDGFNTIEQCVVLHAVYDANDLSMNDKKHDLSFSTIMKEWKEYLQENYQIRKMN